MLSTKSKIVLARAACRVVMLAREMFGVGNTVVVTRGGLRWNLDLTEGIDLTIYLLGMFERSTVRACRRLVRPGAVTLDVGANIGAHTLHLAKIVGPRGRVVAFEPTAFAFRKLVKNVHLNPGLASRIAAEQAMLVGAEDCALKGALYSSWPLIHGADVHRKHGGSLKETSEAQAVTLDRYLQDAKIEKVDFMKIDVDGHECTVLRGGLATLKKSKPTIIIELGPYLLEEVGNSIEELCGLLDSSGYRLTDLIGSRPLPIDPHHLRRLIPAETTINAVALPTGADSPKRLIGGPERSIMPEPSSVEIST